MQKVRYMVGETLRDFRRLNVGKRYKRGFYKGPVFAYVGHMCRLL